MKEWIARKSLQSFCDVLRDVAEGRNVFEKQFHDKSTSVKDIQDTNTTERKALLIAPSILEYDKTLPYQQRNRLILT